MKKIQYGQSEHGSNMLSDIIKDCENPDIVDHMIDQKYASDKFREISDFTEKLYGDTPSGVYAIEHMRMTGIFAELIMSHFPDITEEEMDACHYAAISHDIMKGKHFATMKPNSVFSGRYVPRDIEAYVTKNLNVINSFGLGQYMYSDIKLHALAAGIFVLTEFGITDERTLYCIFFHSCPILEVYEKLPTRTQLLIDIITLADKLSSNFVKPEYDMNIPFDFVTAVFGKSGNEFNFTTGVYIARLLAQGPCSDPCSKRMTEYYYQRAVEQNPLLKLLDNKMDGKTIALKHLVKATDIALNEKKQLKKQAKKSKKANLIRKENDLNGQETTTVPANSN